MFSTSVKEKISKNITYDIVDIILMNYQRKTIFCITPQSEFIEIDNEINILPREFKKRSRNI